MGQVVAKAKQGAEQATQKTDKDAKVVSKPSEAKELINFMGKNYESKVKPATTFDEFYHAIYELIEMFCEERGQLQYKMPSKKKLEEAYKAVHPSGTANLSKNDFMKITEAIITVDSFTFGKAALDVLVVLFGAPVCAILAKRIVPGLKSFSDDIVIPLATSGAVVYLAKTNKL
uniref:Uncharacterized protein n=1 Tax=Avena sativa TaxID=4498 RepID=A0ACD5TGZ5_AVESA